MTSSRNTLIRSIAGLTGDLAVGVAIASACLWLIEYAVLGLFLSFLLWLLGIIVALALSQYIVHPTVKLLLADRKLDRAIAAAGNVAEAIAGHLGVHRTPWTNVINAFGAQGTKAQKKAWADARRFAARFSATPRPA